MPAVHEIAKEIPIGIFRGKGLLVNDNMWPLFQLITSFFFFEAVGTNGVTS